MKELTGRHYDTLIIDDIFKPGEVSIVSTRYHKGDLMKMTKQLSSLCLFFATGRTFTFRDVVVLTDNESQISFEYQAMSDGLSKQATFSKFHVVGVSRVV